MSKKKELILLLLSDLFAVIVTWFVYYYIRIDTGWIIYANNPAFLTPMIAIYIFWIMIFMFSGLYQQWFLRSRFEEFIKILKSVSLGCVLLFFLIFIDDSLKDAKAISRFLILIYWGLLVFSMAFGRVIIRGFQIRLLKKGFGLRNTLIVGTGIKALELKDSLDNNSHHGYKVIGFVGIDGKESVENEIGKLNKILEIISLYKISDIIIAIEPDHKDVIQVMINKCSEINLRLKIMPDLHEIVGGMARTYQLYGIPLVDLMPEVMTYRFKILKRGFDIAFSLFVLIVFLPFSIIITIIIKFTSEGNIIYKQKRIGKDGKDFTLYKFRTMYENSEESGPVWTTENDERITGFGKFFRRTRLDEIPQFFNVLKNDMSIVGPRPERPYFVNELRKEILYYNRRFRIKPGITGWAQIHLASDTNYEDVKNKLKYDFYYIENISITLDLKILINTFFTVLLFKGK